MRITALVGSGDVYFSCFTDEETKQWFAEEDVVI